MLQDIQSLLTGVMPAAVATGLFVSVCTFQDRAGGDTPVLDSSGQVDLDNSDYVDVPGLIGIQCMFAVNVVTRPDSTGGARLQTEFTESGNRHLLLNGYYPGILQRYIVYVDGVLYECTPGAVEHDSQNQMTRLAVRQYSV